MTYYNSHTHQRTSSSNEVIIRNYDLLKEDEVQKDYFSVAIHPWWINENVDNLKKKVKTFLNESRCIAIGECGLDRVCDIDFNKQLEIFSWHIELATKVKKPLIIHCVRAYNEVIHLLKERRFTGNVLFHGYMGNIEISKQLLKYENIYFGLGPQFLNNSKKTSEVLPLLPVSRVMLETDETGQDIGVIYDSFSKAIGLKEKELVDIISRNNHLFFRKTKMSEKS